MICGPFRLPALKRPPSAHDKVPMIRDVNEMGSWLAEPAAFQKWETESTQADPDDGVCHIVVQSRSAEMVRCLGGEGMWSWIEAP